MEIGIVVGIAVVAAFVLLAFGLYFGQNRRSARGDKERVAATPSRHVRRVEPPTQDASARRQDEELSV